MRPVFAISLACTALFSTTAAADESPAYDAASWVDRPLLLPHGTARFGVSLDLSNIDEGTSATGESTSLDLDYGVNDRMQLGVSVSFPVNPSAFGSVYASAIYQVDPNLAVRVDAGFLHGTIVLGDSPSDTAHAFVLNVGAPIRIKLAPGIAFVSGGTTAAALGQPLALPFEGGGIALGASPFYSGQGIASLVVNSGGTISGVVQVPVGVLFDVSDEVAIEGRTALREIFPSGGDKATAVPLGLDVMVHIAPVDVVASVDIAGIVNEDGVGYFDIRQFSVSARRRF